MADQCHSFKSQTDTVACLCGPGQLGILCAQSFSWDKIVSIRSIKILNQNNIKTIGLYFS